MTLGDFARAVLLRLKYTVLTLVALTVIAAAQVFFVFAFLLLTALAFLGSTGHAHQQFVSPFVPFGYFAVGALAAGGILALANAMVLPRPFWLKSIGASAVFGGLVAAINPAVGSWLAGLPTPVLQKIKDLSEASEKREQASVLEFVRNQKAVTEAVGEPFKTSISTTSMTDRVPVRYEIYVSSGERTTYAIVNVSRPSGRTEFSLACVTPVGWANRQAGSDPCKQ